MKTMIVTAILLTLFLTSIMAFNSLPALAAPTWDKNPEDFVHGIALEIDGEYYYFVGPGSVEGVTDVPGHTWVQDEEDPYQVVGRHYNVGPWMVGEQPWWATGEPYGVLLFMVHGIIGPPPGELDPKTERKLRKQGYVHFHELVNVGTGEEVEDIVVYLKHIAVRKFYFDGGPMPGLAHYVSPGIDHAFMPNW